MRAVLTMIVCALLLAACTGGDDIGRMVYESLAKTCDNQQPADQSCGF